MCRPPWLRTRDRRERPAIAPPSNPKITCEKPARPQPRSSLRQSPEPLPIREEPHNGVPTRSD